MGFDSDHGVVEPLSAGAPPKGSAPMNGRSVLIVLKNSDFGHDRHFSERYRASAKFWGGVRPKSIFGAGGQALRVS
jgi:hypothetical protein